MNAELVAPAWMHEQTTPYREGDVFTGVVKVSAPFPVEIGLGQR